MKINLTQNKFTELLRRGYSLDIIYILMLIDAGVDVASLISNNVKIAMLYQTLLRKALITSENVVTISGKDILSFMNTSDRERLIRTKPQNTAFETWWETYPKNTDFEYKGRKFTGDRSLKQGRDACRIKFEGILNEGKYSAEDLINALKAEILRKKEESIKTRTNKMQFMQNSLTYLNNRTFEAFIGQTFTENNNEEEPSIEHEI